MRAVFADCHVGRRPDDEGPFLEGLQRAADRGARSISLLGDVFHFFIAHPKFETPAVRRFLDAVDRLAERNVPVTYVEGNRDFFLRGSYAEHHFREVVDEETFTAGGRRFLATHGDLLNESDLPYRFWRSVSKSSIARASVHFIPRGLGNRIVWKTEARLYRSNFKHKRQLPVEMIRRFARSRFAQGIDTILLGHFHHAWVDESLGGRIEILPAFVDDRRWMEIADDGTTALVGLN
jgi:UDP-2,3-diacylglucosamine hydrolase